MRRHLSFTMIVAAVALISLGSCSMRKKIPYFNGLEPTDSLVGATQHESRICPDDMLKIVVSALEPEAVAPFNLPVVAYASPNTSQIYQTPSFQPYLVDIDGYIEFPVLGRVKVGGLKKSEAIAMLQDQLKAYLKDPIVTIQFMNYKVTVLGEVLRPGSYTIGNERITLMEALGLAGDMTVYGRRDNVLLIRENSNGAKEFVRLNLTKSDILSSPYYYLQQNDVIYVEPGNMRYHQTVSSNATIYLSAVSTLASMATVIVAVINMNNNSGSGN